MDAFENLISLLLRRQGYWTIPSYKVDITKDEKRLIDRPSSPRWELDIVAYKGSTNEVLAVECKSYLDSSGVLFHNGRFEPEGRYKLFNESILRTIVLNRLKTQLQEEGLCAADPKITLCLAAGKIATRSDLNGLASCFSINGWLLFNPDWIRQRLITASESRYENDIAYVVSKLLLRK